MKQIGKGTFTTAYRKNSTTVLLKSCDPIKECMANGWFPNSHLFPTVKKVGDGLYEMNYYHRVRSLKKSLKPTHYNTYKLLRAVHTFGVSTRPRGKENMYNHWYKAFKGIRNKQLRDTLQSALGACLNYGSDIGFEISPRNVAVSKTGGLVLLDCFFNVTALHKAHTVNRRVSWGIRSQ